MTLVKENTVTCRKKQSGEFQQQKAKLQKTKKYKQYIFA